ncbi:NAD(P)H nitroreductase [Paraprevotella clara]|uniref:nitroreductase family protein n=1 Tax=Paraprevotella clara TaxID=454154 RepID=UPI0024934A3B|nr:nitroreductase family protein [Paraprevotella clara]BDI75732.1 NAD(P)H nitroreductase [Paraprevotella clara]
MNLFELIQKRQSDRKYESRPVSREMVMKCLEAARLAPSACNSQPWKFVVVDDVALLPQMGAAAAGMGMNGFAREVPVIVAVVLEKMNLTARIGSVIKDKEYSLLDVGIAVEHFCLQAAELGLGTCIMGWFDEKKVKKLLGIKGKRVPLLISLGYPAGETRKKARKSLEEMSSWNQY